MMRRLLGVASIVLGSLLAACGAQAAPTRTIEEVILTVTPSPAATEVPAVPVLDVAGFVAALKASGAVVEETGGTSGSFFTGQGHILKVNGQEVQVFEYASPDLVQDEAGRISPDGGQITDATGAVAMVDWVDVPHFFMGDRILVVYVGRDIAVEQAIAAITGPQFAGGSSETGLLPVTEGSPGALGASEGSATVVDYQSLAATLQAQGFVVAPGDALEPGFFSNGAQILKVNGEDVQVFKFADEQTAIDEAAKVSPDGGTIGTVAVRWMAPPHFYRAGWLIVLYVGSDESILAGLNAIFGQPFAGS